MKEWEHQSVLIPQDKLDTAINEIAEGGWELVQIWLPTRDDDGFAYFTVWFKRRFSR